MGVALARHKIRNSSLYVVSIGRMIDVVGIEISRFGQVCHRTVTITVNLD